MKTNCNICFLFYDEERFGSCPRCAYYEFKSKKEKEMLEAVAELKRKKEEEYKRVQPKAFSKEVFEETFEQVKTQPRTIAPLYVSSSTKGPSLKKVLIVLSSLFTISGAIAYILNYLVSSGLI